MKKEKFNEIIDNLKLERNEWQYLSEIASIVLKNGRGIYPNWEYERFLITNKHILIKHGISEPYGARLGTNFNIGMNHMDITFPPQYIIQPTPFYGSFRAPRKGDILRSTNGNQIFSESVIREVVFSSNAFVIELLTPVVFNSSAHLSFYDPAQFEKDLCMHSLYADGIYLKFKENNGKKSKFGIFQESISCKDIDSVYLKLSVKNKSYKLN